MQNWKVTDHECLKLLSCVVWFAESIDCPLGYYKQLISD